MLWGLRTSLENFPGTSGFPWEEIFWGWNRSIKKIRRVVSSVTEARNTWKRRQVLHFSACENRDKLLNSSSKIGGNCNNSNNSYQLNELVLQGPTWEHEWPKDSYGVITFKLWLTVTWHPIAVSSKRHFIGMERVILHLCRSLVLN